MQDTYDPFSFLLSEIRAYDSGERKNWDPYQRQHYIDVLLADEAEEIAWGRRHLTIVHGPTDDEVHADILDDLFEAWSEIASGAEWSRIGGVPDHHMTLSVAGADARQRLVWAADVAARANPSRWRLVECAAVTEPAVGYY